MSAHPGSGAEDRLRSLTPLRTLVVEPMDRQDHLRPGEVGAGVRRGRARGVVVDHVRGITHADDRREAAVHDRVEVLRAHGGYRAGWIPPGASAPSEYPGRQNTVTS